MPSPAPWSPASFPRGNAHGLPCVVPDVFLSAWTFQRGVILRKCSWVCLFHLTSRLGELSVLRLTSLPLFFLSCKPDYFFLNMISDLRGCWETSHAEGKHIYPLSVCSPFSVFRLIYSLPAPCPTCVCLYPHGCTCRDAVLSSHLRLCACCCEQG